MAFFSSETKKLKFAEAVIKHRTYEEWKELRHCLKSRSVAPKEQRKNYHTLFLLEAELEIFLEKQPVAKSINKLSSIRSFSDLLENRPQLESITAKLLELKSTFKRLPDGPKSWDEKFRSNGEFETTTLLARAQFFLGQKSDAVSLCQEAENIVQKISTPEVQESKISMTSSTNIWQSMRLSSPSLPDPSSVILTRCKAISMAILFLSGERVSNFDSIMSFLGPKKQQYKKIPLVVALAVMKYTQKESCEVLCKNLTAFDQVQLTNVQDLPKSVNHITIRILLTLMHLKNSLKFDEKGNENKTFLTYSQYVLNYTVAHSLCSTNLPFLFDPETNRNQLLAIYKFLDLTISSKFLKPDDEIKSKSKVSNGFYILAECLRVCSKQNYAKHAYHKCLQGVDTSCIANMENFSQVKSALRLGKSFDNVENVKVLQDMKDLMKLKIFNALTRKNILDGDFGELSWLVNFINAFLLLGIGDLKSSLEAAKRSLSEKQDWAHSWLLLSIILFEHQMYSKTLQTISFGTKAAKNQPDLLLQFLQLEADTYSVLHSSSEILTKSETENYSSKTEKIHMQIIKTCDKLIETDSDVGLSTFGNSNIFSANNLNSSVLNETQLETRSTKTLTVQKSSNLESRMTQSHIGAITNKTSVFGLSTANTGVVSTTGKHSLMSGESLNGLLSSGQIIWDVGYELGTDAPLKISTVQYISRCRCLARSIFELAKLRKTNQKSIQDLENRLKLLAENLDPAISAEVYYNRVVALSLAPEQAVDKLNLALQQAKSLSVSTSRQEFQKKLLISEVCLEKASLLVELGRFDHAELDLQQCPVKSGSCYFSLAIGLGIDVEDQKFSFVEQYLHYDWLRDFVFDTLFES